MEAVGLLAGGISHDYNNLLGVILGNADLLLETTPTAVQQHYAEQIKKATRRAADLTRQLLAFSRKQILYPVILDLNAVVRDVGKILQRLIGEDVQIVTDLETSLDSTRADRGQIEQILMNLAGSEVSGSHACKIVLSCGSVRPGSSWVDRYCHCQRPITVETSPFHSFDLVSKRVIA
jgi:signal transduction histidine kinase